MKVKKKFNKRLRLGILAIFAFFLFLSLTTTAHAADFDITQVPHNIADSLGTTDDVGGLIATTIIFMALLFPTALITKSPIVLLAVAVLGLGITTMLLWIPSWLFILIAAGEGLMLATTVRQMLTGGGGED